MAVTRRDPEDPEGNVLTPQHVIGLQDILSAYTIGGARACFSEEELGSLEVGKRADLIAIDRDPFAIPPAELSDMTVVRTWIDGREVYRSGD